MDTKLLRRLPRRIVGWDPRSGPYATETKSATVTQGKLRSINLTALLPTLVVAGAVTIALDAQSWWHAAGLSLGVIAAVVAFVRWAAGNLASVALPCLVVAAATWIFGVQVADSATAFFGIAIVGSYVVPQLRTHRATGAVALAVFVAGVGASRLLITTTDLRTDLFEYVVFPTALTIVLTGLMFPNKHFYDVVADLEESRERDAELAVFRERVRFASDLHDIQGHTLHVVKLKVALAQKLVHSDTQRVEQELHEIYGLVSETISKTKDLAHAKRRLNLSAELENAKNLFEAAGIRVRIVGESTGDAPVSELLGQVLRETTTNILRHAQASDVRITLSTHGIAIVNDGVQDETLPPLRGLSTLRQRVADEGGDLSVEVQDGRFLTAATFAPPVAPGRSVTGRDDG